MKYRINERNSGSYTLESERKSRKTRRVSQQRANTPHGSSKIYKLVDSLSIKICIGCLEMTYPELKEAETL